MMRKQFSAKDQKSDSKIPRVRPPSRTASPNQELKLIKVREVMALNRSRAQIDQAREKPALAEKEKSSDAGSVL